MEKAKRTYNEAKSIIGTGFAEMIANRLYYAAYYAVTALLIANGVTVKTHSGVKAMFSLHFIKTRVLDKRFGVIFSTLFSLRMTGDYEDRRNLDMAMDVLPLVEPAGELIAAVAKLTREHMQL